MSVRAAVVGAAGYIGGELLRLLLLHPRVDLVAVTSVRRAGRRVDGCHPNLRGLTDLRFTSPADLDDEYDVVFLATPHGETMTGLAQYTSRAGLLIDLSADFRLRDPAVFRSHYGVEHAAPGELDSFVYGLPELHRGELRGADRIAVPGCMAAAAILALHPLAAGDAITGRVVVDARTGSSGAGAAAGQTNLHAERSGALRVFAPVGHRHEAEIGQAIGRPVSMTATGVEAVRGVQVVCHVTLRDGVDDVVLRGLYRQHYRDERFVRVVAARRGNYRLPEPKILAGSNYCDVGFATGTASGAAPTAAVAVGALDNLMKGGAGNAVQCMNLRLGWPESLGLEFPGLHPS
ncbi:N-acetyl-gamma-glutamyl-phosphate reductase [Streptomyces sp. NPDC003247]|uniref:N-acetyl-gamma-glutamyl-phosphate reductase n=1 Tax=Streptomyces sp. NPDC003247 TaxID=3364677 RepID=UPI00369B9064